VKKLTVVQAQLAIAALATLLFARAAYAETWYLMAADPEVISEPRAASMMVKGAVAGPVHFVSQGGFDSRSQCESDRHKLIQDWRQHSIIARGGWAKHGFTAPNIFAQCIGAGDPRLSKSSGPNPTMDYHAANAAGYRPLGRAAKHTLGRCGERRSSLTIARRQSTKNPAQSMDALTRATLFSAVNHFCLVVIPWKSGAPASSMFLPLSLCSC
jgi:hypothetical protein